MKFGALFSLTAFITGIVALDFSNSNWIWTNQLDSAGNAPAGATAAFRREYTAPAGKTPVSAQVVITADNAYTFFVNGQAVGNDSDFTAAETYCVRLDPYCNVFAVSSTNLGDVNNPAGLLAAIQITFSDGSTDNIVTDSSWRANTPVPQAFAEVTFDDSTWPAARVEVAFGKSSIALWNQVTIPSNVPLGLTNSKWIWTNEVARPTDSAPIGVRAFRKAVTLPAGQSATSGTFIITADNNYTLYVQGSVVGSGANFGAAQRYVVNFPSPTTEVEIAVAAANVPPGGPAGLIVAVEVDSEDYYYCPSRTVLVSDGTWKYSIAVPSGFQNPGFDDSAWPAAIVEGSYGVSPWGPVPVSA